MNFVIKFYVMTRKSTQDKLYSKHTVHDNNYSHHLKGYCAYAKNKEKEGVEIKKSCFLATTAPSIMVWVRTKYSMCYFHHEKKNQNNFLYRKGKVYIAKRVKSTLPANDLKWQS